MDLLFNDRRRNRSLSLCIVLILASCTLGSHNNNNNNQHCSTEHTTHKPLIPRGHKATNEELKAALCKIPKIQNHSICPTIPGFPNMVYKRDEDYCDYLGEMLSFKTASCFSLDIDANESPTQKDYTLDACGLNYYIGADTDNTTSHWYFISWNNTCIPQDHLIGNCTNNPLVMYRIN